MTDVMDERAYAIRLEPPGEEGEGIEFWVHRPGAREYCQVKRQEGTNGRWSLAELASRRVLSAFWEKLQHLEATCIFVSMHAAYQLDELASRARGATSYEEFRQFFLQSDVQRRAFDDLCLRWGNCHGRDAYGALGRVWVKTVDEDTLSTIVESRLAALVEGDATTVADVLAQLALDAVHQELTAQDIWHHLEGRGFRRRQWGKDPRVLSAVKAANERYLSPLRVAAIAGEAIPRDEVETVLDMLTSPERTRGVLLTGEAGVGKSGVILQAVESLQEQGWPLVIFRVDRLEPTLLPSEVGRQLGLPDSPANVLAAIAQNRECVLVIDQLDATSLASGRHPQFFDCVYEILQQAQAHPHMRLLLACRTFDVDNDPRLRRLSGETGIGETVPVNRLSHTTVREVVADLEFDAGRLDSRQLDLLSIPLHLSLLAEIAASTSIDVLDFQTAKDLYDRFWDYKQDVIRMRIGRSIQWTWVVDTLCDYMSDRQILSAPPNTVDDYGHDAQAMASEHVLIRDGQRYSFFHEGFFDYAFARRFAARGRELLPLLRSSEQHLFRRAQVRQILVHEREADFTQYLADLWSLLTSPDIRFHLKRVVFGLLAQLSDPTEDEWRVLSSLMGNPEDALTSEVWRTLHGSTAWFLLLDSLGIVRGWLSNPSEDHVSRAVMLLSSVQRQLPDHVAELVEPYVGASAEWNKQLVYLSQWADVSAGRRFFDLFLLLIDQGILDEARGPIAVNSDFWSLIYSLPGERPEWACEVIGHYFERRLTLSRAAGSSHPFTWNAETVPDSQLHEEIFMRSARGAPLTFIKEVLPFKLRVMSLTAEQTGDPPWRDPVWQYRFLGPAYTSNAALLAAMESALSLLATSDSEAFASVAIQLSMENFETVQYLLIRAYTANGARFADEAAEYICNRPARLRTGYGDNSYWATRQLIEAITPHCSAEWLIKLEELILNYYPAWERSVEGHRAYGHAQLILLEGIIPSRRSVVVSRRLEEWRRKFGGHSVEPPRALDVRQLESPVPEHAAERMTDDQWLSAVSRYSHDQMRALRDGGLLGGADELAQLLAEQVKREPARFAKLACRFPDDTHPAYFDAVLRGVTEGGLDDTQLVLDVCRRCHQLPSRPCGRWICRAIAKLAERPLPEEASAIVAWYATEDPDPEQELWCARATGRDILTAAINSVRGSAAEAMAKLVFADGKRVASLLPSIERMVRDPSIAARCCVADLLSAVLKYDRELAIRLFEQLCDTEDALLKTHYVDRFLFYALQTHFEKLRPLVERMIRSLEPEVAIVGARQACLASLFVEEARLLAERCISGTEAQQMGAAEVCAANLRTASFRSICEECLITLFNSPYEKVRSKAGICFHGFGGEELSAYEELVDAFVQSPAFASHYFHLIYALDQTTAKLPNVTCLACEQFLNTFGREAGDIRTGHAADADMVCRLILRAYSQTRDEGLQARCLELIDRMTQARAFGFEKVLALYDR
jgi:hypothetical protein